MLTKGCRETDEEEKQQQSFAMSSDIIWGLMWSFLMARQIHPVWRLQHAMKALHLPKIFISDRLSLFYRSGDDFTKEGELYLFSYLARSGGDK